VDKSLSTISIEQRLCRIRGEYLEMPGLRLTSAQAQRLLGLDQESCLQLLESLTRERFLYRHADGTYTRQSH
jgi:DNA-binding IclR family transcriptional regulator